MAKETQSQKQQKAIETIVGSYKLSVSGVYPQDDGGSVSVDVDGSMNGLKVKWVSKIDKEQKPQWVVGIF